MTITSTKYLNVMRFSFILTSRYLFNVMESIFPCQIVMLFQSAKIVRMGNYINSFCTLKYHIQEISLANIAKVQDKHKMLLPASNLERLERGSGWIRDFGHFCLTLSILQHWTHPNKTPMLLIEVRKLRQIRSPLQFPFLWWKNKYSGLKSMLTAHD